MKPNAQHGAGDHARNLDDQKDDMDLSDVFIGSDEAGPVPICDEREQPIDRESDHADATQGCEDVLQEICQPQSSPANLAISLAHCRRAGSSSNRSSGLSLLFKLAIVSATRVLALGDPTGTPRSRPPM